MTNSLDAKDEAAKECARHFKTAMGYTQKTSGWVPQCRSLLNSQSLTPDELKEFMTWAAQENTDAQPQFNSVEYLAASNDPMKTLVKHADGLIRKWRSRKRTAGITRVKAADPMPRDLAEWLMLGRGINTPLSGWRNATEKMNAIKLCWYGKGGEAQPNPEGIDIEALFARYQQGLGINTQ